jgi:branched-chain amino acid transport system substrate-binding protein
MNKIIWIIAAVIAVIGLGYWSQSVAPTEVVKVGVIAPLTGAQAEVGGYIKSGLQLAEEEINKGGRQKISLIFEDSQYKPDLAVAGIRKLIDVDKVHYVIASEGSSQSLAVAPIAEQNKVVLMVPLSQASQLTEAGDYIFRSQVNVQQEVDFLAPVVFKMMGSKKVGVMVLNNDYGVDNIEKFSKAYSALGGQIGVTEKFNSTDKDFRTSLLKIKADKPEAVYIIGVRNLVGTIIKQAAELGLSVKFFSTSAMEGKSFLDTAGVFGEGIVYPYPFDENSPFPTQKEYQEKYLAKFGSRSEQNAANSYDALMLINYCLNKVGDSSEGVKNCLYKVKDFPGATGSLTFDQNGDVSKSFILKTVKNGQFVPYK